MTLGSGFAPKILLPLLAAGLGVAGYVGLHGARSPSGAGSGAGTPASMVPVTVATSGGPHVFTAEVAGTAAAQEKGLMFRTRIDPDGGMLFWPYPPAGAPPHVASFWMKNTPSPLDIVFIRADGTIARIAENAVPFDETPLSSGEPVGAVLELRGGRAAELGIAEGQKVTWPK